MCVCPQELADALGSSPCLCEILNSCLWTPRCSRLNSLLAKFFKREDEVTVNGSALSGFEVFFVWSDMQGTIQMDSLVISFAVFSDE